jgi:hypothetical protein
VAGTRIDTPTGPVPVECLHPGDLVLTKDHGPQPIRWTGQRTLRAQGPMAPIEIAKGTFGDHETVRVSPEHRVFVTDAMAELLFGEAEVLIAAKHLVNDLTVRPRPGGFVTYVHLMFESHEVIFSQGLMTESFLLGPETKNIFEPKIVEEICSIFTEINPDSGQEYPATARRTLREHEAAVLHTKWIT